MTKFPTMTYEAEVNIKVKLTKKFTIIADITIDAASDIIKEAARQAQEVFKEDVAGTWNDCTLTGIDFELHEIKGRPATPAEEAMEVNLKGIVP